MLINVFPLELAVVDSHSFDLNFEAICYLPIREQKKKLFMRNKYSSYMAL